MSAFAWMLPLHEADGLVKQQPISQHSLRAMRYKVSHNVNARSLRDHLLSACLPLRETELLRGLQWGNLASHPVFFPQSHKSAKRDGAEWSAEDPEMQAKQGNIHAFLRRWWWWMSQNSCNGNVLALLESLTSPSSSALLPSTPAAAASQGKAPEPHLTQVQSHRCLFLLQKCRASESA